MSLLDSAPLRQVFRIGPSSSVLCEFSGAREVSNDAKDAFLPLSRSTSDSGEKLLIELSRIDPWAASQFGLKNLAVQDFVMRLWYESLTQPVDALQQKHSSFIILSYTWHDSSEWTRHPSLLGCPSKHTDHPLPLTPAMWSAFLLQQWTRHPSLLGCPSKHTDHPLPLTPAMWSAFLLQRLGPSEGVWCDQVCIVQDSSQEKKTAIGAMDLLYKNARKVVVALEDIAVTKEEMDALFKVSMDFRPSQGGRIARAFEKIVHARWFRRAWCLHEFLVSRNHTFLIPVSGEGGDGMVTRLDALFLAIRADYFGKSEYLGFLSKKYTLLASPDQDLSLIHTFGMRLKLLSMLEGNEPELFYAHGTYTGMQTFSEVFSLGAKVMSDKISIVLSVMNSGLYYLGSISLMEEDCLRLATVVALASGDPEALTTNGGPVHSPNRKPSAQWLWWPSLADTTPQLGSDPSLPRIDTNLGVTEQGLELDMQFICTSADMASAEPRYLSIARVLIDHRTMCSISSADRQCTLWQDHQDDHKSIRLRNIQALACALQLGQDWIHGVHNRLHLTADIQGRMRNHRLDVLKKAVEWALSLEIEKGLGSDRGETWYRENGEVDITSSILSPEAQNWYYNLLNFADRLRFTGPAVSDAKSNHVAAYADTEFAVQILDFSSAGILPFLVFAPVCDQPDPGSSLTLCMPEVLANEEYRDLSRLWILKKCREDGTGRSFELVSKSRMIGTAFVPKGVGMGKVVIVN